MRRLLVLGLITVGLLTQAAHAAATNCIVSAQPVALSTGVYFVGGTATIPPYQAGTTPAVFSIPIYVATNSNKNVQGLFTTLPALTDGFGNSIPVTYSYTHVASATELPLTANTWMQVMPNGQPQDRDGTVIVGYINIIAPALLITQAAGLYTTGSITADISLDSGAVPSTGLGYMTLNGSVDEFIVMGFADTSLLGSGVYFVGEIIDFGILVAGFSHPAITKNLFVHTNRNATIKITFANTPPLLSIADGVTTLGMTYSYNLNGVSGTIVAGTPIAAVNGVNDGTTSIGTLTFSPDAVPGGQLSGAYTATVTVIVAAQ